MKTRRYVMTGRAARMAETRARILDCAVALYVERGIDDLTLEAVANCAGTTVQTILRIHGSRDRLFYAALEKLARSGVPLKPTLPGDVTGRFGRSSTCTRSAETSSCSGSATSAVDQS